MQPTSDHPLWQVLDKLHTFISDQYEATDDVDARRLLDSLLLTIGGVDVAIREDTVTNTLVCTEAKKGLVKGDGDADANGVSSPPRSTGAGRDHVRRSS